MKLYFFETPQIPADFKYPDAFIEYTSHSPVPYLEPWWFLCEFKDNADFWLAQLKKQYPGRNLVPFAKRSISDDVACFDGASGSSDPKVYYVHVYASPGWEDRGSVVNFSAWLKEAEAESAEFKKEENA